jgi:hypothetical protein
MTNSNETNWWVFFPILGIEITDEQHDLDQPIFGDATLVSKSHIAQIVPLLKLNEQGTSSHDNEKFIMDLLIEHATLRKKFRSYIAVKRKGLASLHGEKRVGDGNSIVIVEKAAHRAAQIVALLALSLISNSSEWETCGLVSQAEDEIDSIAMIALEARRFAFQTSAKQSFTRIAEPLRITREKLRNYIADSAFADVAAILKPQKSLFGKSLSRAVIESSIRLTEALHSHSSAGKLLGAVTSMEILISHQGDSYEATMRRIRELVGEPGWEQFEGERVINERHRYVHQGLEPSHGLMPAKATALGLACLIQFAKLVKIFPHKTAILKYLDFLNMAKLMMETWSETERSSFNIFIKHEPFEPKFPYFENKHSKVRRAGKRSASRL